jgi:hypothetical protein
MGVDGVGLHLASLRQSRRWPSDIESIDVDEHTSIRRLLGTVGAKCGNVIQRKDNRSIAMLWNTSADR